MKYTFREFLSLDEEHKIALGSRQMNEELTKKIKDKKMVELEKALKSHDWWYSFSDDGRTYKKGKKESEDIRKLVNLIGDDGMSLYKQYGKKAGVMEGKMKRKRWCVPRPEAPACSDVLGTCRGHACEGSA